MKTICIAGKNQIACDSLKYALDSLSKSDYRILVLPNSSDMGVDDW